MGSTTRGRVGEERETGAGTTSEEQSVAAGAARVPSVLQPTERMGVENREGGDAGVERAARRASDRGADSHVAPHHVRGVRSRTGGTQHTSGGRSGRTAHRQTCSSSARRRPGASPHWDQGSAKGGYTRRGREPRWAMAKHAERALGHAINWSQNRYGAGLVGNEGVGGMEMPAAQRKDR